jgi:hypothetical protein
VGDLHLVVGSERTQNQIWALTTTGGWSPIRAAPKSRRDPELPLMGGVFT